MHLGSSWLSGPSRGDASLFRVPCNRLTAQLGSGSAAGSPVVQQLGCCLAWSRHLGNICCEKVVEDSLARILEPRNGPSVAGTGLSPYPGRSTLPLAAPKSRCAESCLEAGGDLRPAGSGASRRHVGMCAESPASLTYKEPEVGQEICGL